MSNCCLGSTSVNHSGSKSTRPIRNNCKTNERRVGHVLLLRCATLESSRLSSNRTLSRAAEATGPNASGSSARFLLANSETGRVIEVDAKGKLFWEATVAGATGVERQPGGTTLVATNERVVELDRRGKVIWEKKADGYARRIHRR